MRINNNLMAANTNRVLGVNQNNASKAIEKLSSGYRINRAGDDAAGLAISEKMRAQIRGLNQASRNAQDASSLLQTAEGALNETHEILQRMRQLAVQGANDTNVDEDRKQLNNEITQLKSELNRIANDTEFNTQKLMNYGAKLQADGFEGISQSAVVTLNEKIPGWINDAMTALNSNFGIDHPDSPTKRRMDVSYVNEPTSGAAATMSTADSGATLKLTINLAAATDASGDLISEGQLDTLVAHEIMHAYQYTEMATMLGGGGLSDEEYWVAEGLAVLIQGGNGLVSTALSGNAANANLLDANTDGAVETFNNSGAHYASAYVAMKTLHEITDGGINAIIDRLEAGDSIDQAINNTTQQVQGEVAALGGRGINATGYSSFDDFVLDFNEGDFNAYLSTSTDFTAGTGAILDGSTAGSSGNVSTDDTIQNGTGTSLVYTHYDLQFTTDSSSVDNPSTTPQELTFHIGSNEGQNVKFQTFDVTSNGLGLDSANVSTQKTSNESITVINDAITRVSDLRAGIGALQNRVEHTMKNLDNASENLQASESRIKDLDMAKGMMEFTKNNILSQAAQSMLAQANQAPQGVLQLLR